MSGRVKWLSRDPIEEKGGLNLYGFVANDPINMFDWLGLAGTDCCCRIALIIEVPGDSPSKLGRKGLDGHTGIGIDDDYHDYGPTPQRGSSPIGSPGRPWWDGFDWVNPSGNASLQNILDNLNDLSKGNDTYMVTAYVNQSECDKVKKYWENLYNKPGNYRFYARQCTTTACKSLREAGLINGRALKPTSFLRHLERNLKHTCGDKKGQPADVQQIHYGTPLSSDGYE